MVRLPKSPPSGPLLSLRTECPRLEGEEEQRRKRAGLVLEGRDFPSPGIDKPWGTDGDSKSNALAAHAARAGRTDRGGELTIRGVPLGARWRAGGGPGGSQTGVSGYCRLHPEHPLPVRLLGVSAFIRKDIKTAAVGGV